MSRTAFDVIRVFHAWGLVGEKSRSSHGVRLLEVLIVLGFFQVVNLSAEDGRALKKLFFGRQSETSRYEPLLLWILQTSHMILRRLLVSRTLLLSIHMRFDARSHPLLSIRHFRLLQTLRQRPIIHFGPLSLRLTFLIHLLHTVKCLI